MNNMISRKGYCQIRGSLVSINSKDPKTNMNTMNTRCAHAMMTSTSTPTDKTSASPYRSIRTIRRNTIKSDVSRVREQHTSKVSWGKRGSSAGKGGEDGKLHHGSVSNMDLGNVGPDNIGFQTFSDYSK